ncbi:MAG: autotransporter domain-containing protein, partial [Gammaproteobacteria bacterium]|nr:autotransporter domain-containing protein [Gammaproteobacteria bacterium]
LTATGANPPTTRATVGWAAMGGGVTGRFGSVTLANGNSQSVRIAIPQDNDLEAPENLVFVLTPPAGALCFGDPIASCNTGIGMGSVTVMVNNDDTAGVTVTPTALNVPEGDAAAYSVRLDARPGMGNTVTITPSIASGGDAHVSIATTALTFDNDNWNRAQSVTVTSTDTAMRGQTATINHAVSASLTGSEYSSATAAPVAVTIVEPRTAEKLHRTVLPQLARAVAGAQMNAIAERAAAAADGGAGGGYGFNLNGANTLDGAAAANMRALAGAADDADIDWKEALRDTDFSLPLSAGHGHGAGGGADLAFWGGSSYSDFAGEDRDTDWDGDMFSLYTGFDARVRPHMRAGLMLSYVDSESDYSTVAGRSVESGEYEMEMTTMSPYLNWRRHDGNAWVTVGYGSGEVEVRPDNDNPDRLNEVNMQNFGIGGVKTLSRAGAREVRVKADVFEANAEVEGNATGGIEGDINVDVHRVRIALESRRTRALAGGAQLTPALEIGARHDGGDGRTGGGMELGGKLHYHDPGLGLTVEARARYLVGHSAAGTRDWGIGGLARLAPGADGQGLAVTLTPAYGATESGADDLWKNGLAAARTSDSTDAAAAKHLAARMDAEIGYGMPVADLRRALGLRARGVFGGVFGVGDGVGSGDGAAAGSGSAGGAGSARGAGLFGAGMLTPYSALRLGDSKRDYRFGVKWTSADRLALNLSARRLDGGAADNIVALEGRLDF